ncbi:unnamed protein product, partial [Ectocarpus sp. 12 AP-2014]
SIWPCAGVIASVFFEVRCLNAEHDAGGRRASPITGERQMCIRVRGVHQPAYCRLPLSLIRRPLFDDLALVLELGLRRATTLPPRMIWQQATRQVSRQPG